MTTYTKNLTEIIGMSGLKFWWKGEDIAKYVCGVIRDKNGYYYVSHPKMIFLFETNIERRQVTVLKTDWYKHNCKLKDIL